VSLYRFIALSTTHKKKQFALFIQYLKSYIEEPSYYYYPIQDIKEVLMNENFAIKCENIGTIIEDLKT